MLEIFDSVLTAQQDLAVISVTEFLLCTLVSLVLGLAAALIHMFRNSYNKGFVVTLALLPPVVQLVIMLVNGNLGAGLAVMGAFALVRFRSIPGNARDIAAVFISMAIGLATGMGFLAIAALFVLIIGAANIIYTLAPFGLAVAGRRQLRIAIPETLDYSEVFQPVFERFTTKAELVSLRTSNMGSLYKLAYEVTLRSGVSEKEFIDELRVRNGNLEVALGRGLFNAGAGEL
jgi:uncharacterized membrane protein YhiD involved in acid resistance